MNLLTQACNIIKKKTLAQVFSCEFCEISKNRLCWCGDELCIIAICINCYMRVASVSKSETSIAIGKFKVSTLSANPTKWSNTADELFECV